MSNAEAISATGENKEDETPLQQQSGENRVVACEEEDKDDKNRSIFFDPELTQPNS